MTVVVIFPKLKFGPIDLGRIHGLSGAVGSKSVFVDLEMVKLCQTDPNLNVRKLNITKPYPK